MVLIHGEPVNKQIRHPIVKHRFTGKVSIYYEKSQELLYHMLMKTIVPYIEKVKTRFKIDSYGKTMVYLGMQKQAWTAIQKGQGVSEKNAIRIGHAIGVDPLEIMAISMALKAKNRESRDIWLKLAKRLEADNSSDVRTKV